MSRDRVGLDLGGLSDLSDFIPKRASRAGANQGRDRAGQQLS